MKRQIAVLLLAALCSTVSAFNMVMMGRPRGNLKRSLDSEPEKEKKMTSGSLRSMNQGRGQEITGVTLPAEGAYCRISVLAVGRNCLIKLAFHVRFCWT